MEKRKIIFGDYDTALHGPWTLGPWSFPEPEPQENLVTVPGKDGPLDLSTVLTDGEPVYGPRKLTASLECSEGTRLDREAMISAMVNQLDGRRMNIILPDDPTRYITGKVRVKKEYNDPAHAAVTVTAACEPWRFNALETRILLVASASERLSVLPNTGRRVVIPEVVATGALVVLSTEEYTWDLTPGTYKLPELKLKPGNMAVTYSGSGTVAFSYREAVL